MVESFEIRPLQPAEAEALCACFERCYGRSYVASFVYDPGAIRARMAAGDLYPFVAITGGGEVIGHMALTRRHAGARTVEAGNTVVDPRYRGHGLAARLGAALIEACRTSGFCGFHHYPTTAHPIMQKLAVQGGGVETGVMLAYIPDGTDYKELGGASDQGRLAVVVVYQPITVAPPQPVHVPERYRTLLQDIYERAGVQRSLQSCSPPSGPTRISAQMDAARSLLRLDVDAAGTDIASCAAAMIAQHAAAITHVDLLLCDPAVEMACDALRAEGFFYCCLLPDFGRCDVLRLQHVRDKDEVLRPPLVHREAQSILDAALKERERRQDLQ